MSSISIVGGETPLGREVRDRLNELRVGGSISMVGATEEDAIVLTEHEGEPAVLTPLDEDRLRTSDLVICTSDAASARSARQLAGGESAPPFIDLTYGLEPLPDARLRSPLTEGTGYYPLPTGVSVIAHPAASALALLLLKIQGAFPIRLSVVQILEPVSERGQAGLSELQQQVTALLAFRPMNKQIFDAQIAFNLLGRFGEDAPETLQNIEARVERHLASLLAGAAPMPSFRLIQAPVFHGHSFGIWIEFENLPEMEDLEAELESSDIEVRGSDVESPSNVSAAGQSGISTGLIEPDRNHPRAVWIWAAADKYRVMADNAAAVARQILEGRRA